MYLKMFLKIALVRKVRTDIRDSNNVQRFPTQCCMEEKSRE